MLYDLFLFLIQEYRRYCINDLGWYGFIETLSFSDGYDEVCLKLFCGEELFDLFYLMAIFAFSPM